MSLRIKSLTVAAALAVAPLLAPAAEAQVAVTVNPYRARPPMTALTKGGVRVPVWRAAWLKRIGPRYINPRRAPVLVLRRGSTVPGYVPTTLVENRNVPGLMPRGDYAYFITTARRTVFLTPDTRTVVKIMR